MSTPAKILVIILFLLSMVFVLISMKTYGEIDSQANLISTLQTSSGEQKTTVDAMNTAIGSAKEKISSLNGTIETLNGEVETITQAKAAVEAQLVAEQEAKAQVEQKLATALAEVNPLKKQVKDFTEQVAQLQNNNSQLSTSLAKSQKVANTANKELNEVRSVIASYPNQWERMRNPERSRDLPSVRAGEIFTVKDHGINSIVFHGSSMIGKGDSFNVMRDNKKIGKYVVGDVYRTIVICREKSGKINGPLQKGDVLNP